MVFIYILQLEQGKYYVGKTNNPQIRLESHFQSNGSAWTKLYKPIQVLEMIPDCDDYDEDKYTRKYMDTYGIHNVRGGSFVTIELDKSTVDLLKQMSNGTNDKCFKCGKEGHFVKDCDFIASLQNIYTPEDVDSEFITSVLTATHQCLPTNNNMKFSCEECLYFTDRKSCFEQHKISKAHIERVSNEFDGKFKCKICNKTYKSNNGYYSHRKKCIIKKKIKDEEDKEKKIKDGEDLRKSVIGLYKQNTEIKNMLIEFINKNSNQ